MTHNPARPRIRLQLTRRQQAQIRAATGREVSALELGLEGLPEPAAASRPQPAPRAPAGDASEARRGRAS